MTRHNFDKILEMLLFMDIGDHRTPQILLYKLQAKWQSMYKNQSCTCTPHIYKCGIQSFSIDVTPPNIIYRWVKWDRYAAPIIWVYIQGVMST